MRNEVYSIAKSLAASKLPEKKQHPQSDKSQYTVLQVHIYNFSIFR